MHLAIRILRWTLGLLLISTLLLKEDSEKNVQSLVETWWVRLAYGQDAALSTVTAFLRVLSRLTGSIFDRLFGRRLFSPRGVGVSVCYSIASFFLCLQLVMVLSPRPPGPASLELWLYVFLFLFLGSVPALRARSEDETLLLWGLSVVALVFIPVFKFMDFLRQKPQAILSAGGFAVFVSLILIISCGSDFLYIALTRWMLRKASELEHWASILGIVLLDCILALAIFLGPLLLGALAIWKLNHSLLSQISHQGHELPKINPNQLAPGSGVAVMIMLAGPALNTIDFLACSLFFVLMLLMLVHRLFWPLLEGPIYIFQRYTLIKHKGLLATAGVSLLFGKSIWSALSELIGKL